MVQVGITLAYKYQWRDWEQITQGRLANIGDTTHQPLMFR